jgi:hypothetical protein
MYPILPALVSVHIRLGLRVKYSCAPPPIQIHILDPIYPEQFIQRNSSGEIDEDNIRQAAKKNDNRIGKHNP